MTKRTTTQIALVLAAMVFSCGSETKQGQTDDLCGNGRIDADEECDGDNLAGMSCETLLAGYGALSCTADCHFDQTGCADLPPTCGNNVLETGEECDGEDLGSLECATQGFATGSLACNGVCRVDWSGCPCDHEDSHEPNESMTQAAPLTGSSHSLTLCNPAAAEDWFVVPLNPGDRLGVQIVMEDESLDLDLALLDETWTLLELSAQNGTIESAHTTVTEAGNVYVQVFPFSSLAGTVDYDLDLFVNPECTTHADCPTSSICHGFVCETVTCVEDANCPDDLHCDGEECVECVEETHCADHPMVGCIDNRCTLTCQEDVHGSNHTSAEAVALTNAYTGTALTLCTEAPSDWYSLELESLHAYGFEVSFSHTHGDVDVMLYEASDLVAPVAGGYSTTDNELFSYAVPGDGAGTHLLEVSLLPGSLGQLYDLTVADLGIIECASTSDCSNDDVCLSNTCQTPECQDDEDCSGNDRCVAYACVVAPPGDSCAAPIAVTSLPFASHGTDIAAYRPTFALADCTPFGTSGKDVFYQLTLTAGQVMIVKVDATFDAAVLVLDACGAAACLTGVDAEPAGEVETVGFVAPAAGSYMVVIDSSIPGDRLEGQFDLEIESP